jgi:predicted membrane protein
MCLDRSLLFVRFSCFTLPLKAFLSLKTYFYSVKVCCFLILMSLAPCAAWNFDIGIKPVSVVLRTLFAPFAPLVRKLFLRAVFPVADRSAGRNA